MVHACAVWGISWGTLVCSHVQPSSKHTCQLWGPRLGEPGGFELFLR